MDPRRQIPLIVKSVSSAHNPRLKADVIDMTKGLRDGLGLDSVAMIDLMVEVETRFDIRFDPLDPDIESAFTTLLALCEFVEKKISQRQDLRKCV